MKARGRRMHALAPVLMLALAACYRPRLVDCVVACDQVNPRDPG